MSLTPPHDGGAPAETSAEAGAGDDVTLLYLAGRHRLGKGKGNGSGRCVAVLFQVADHLVHGNAQTLGDDLHDADVSLPHHTAPHCVVSARQLARARATACSCVRVCVCLCGRMDRRWCASFVSIRKHGETPGGGGGGQRRRL